jgi:Fe-S-cluster containining protein
MENEWKSGKYLYSFTTAPDFVDDKSLPTVAVQQKPGGGCVYFQNDRCSIYEDRPVACRQFDCRKGHHPKLAPLVKEKFGIEM